jgi:hypothetical protein
MPGGIPFNQVSESEIHQTENETTSNITAIYNRLAQVEPIPLLKFILNPRSFSQTVENLFYTSFLVRDGRLAIEEEDEELVCCTAEPPDAKQLHEEDCSRIQNVFHLDLPTWKVYC